MRYVHLITLFLVLAVKRRVFAQEFYPVSDLTEAFDVSLGGNADNGDSLDLLNLDYGSAFAFNNIDNESPALFADDSLFNGQELYLKESETNLFAEENHMNSCNDLQPLGRNRARSNEFCHENEGIISLPHILEEEEDWYATPEGLATTEEVGSWFCPIRFFQGILRFPVCNILASQGYPVPGSWARLAELPLKNLQYCWPCRLIFFSLFISSRLFCMYRCFALKFGLKSPINSVSPSNYHVCLEERVWCCFQYLPGPRWNPEQVFFLFTLWFLARRNRKAKFPFRERWVERAPDTGARNPLDMQDHLRNKGFVDFSSWI